MAESKKIYLSKEDFLRGVTLEAEDFTGPIGTVSLRGLSTLEVNRLSRGAESNEIANLVHLLVAGMVYPQFTADDADALLNGSLTKILPYVQRIQALSGMTTGKEQAENFDSLSGGGS